MIVVHVKDMILKASDNHYILFLRKIKNSLTSVHHDPIFRESFVQHEKIEALFLSPTDSISRIDRKKDKTERKILDSQERAFWDVHRPVVNGFLRC